ncbi:hypothetical protein CBR_g1035 [Chara braunii]|uniref:Cytochrome b-c1 complex subunit 8 n=1 Tax=Chara braunii TaxID=69332 RepID=A0A388KD44_CHABU|nr:hypothetical protein CBR_g1035 [Chara braunii]|eukprot:GBG67916.1 hypothetical protein CBR_g1035 [Chara braunii]
MGKMPVRLKEVVYTLSPFEQKIMSGLWKDAGYKLQKKVTDNWVNAIFLLGPVLGTTWYAQNFKENEKLHHRF